jgi:hypothetical protein
VLTALGIFEFLSPPDQIKTISSPRSDLISKMGEKMRMNLKQKTRPTFPAHEKFAMQNLKPYCPHYTSVQVKPKKTIVRVCCRLNI